MASILTIPNEILSYIARVSPDIAKSMRLTSKTLRETSDNRIWYHHFSNTYHVEKYNPSSDYFFRYYQLEKHLGDDILEVETRDQLLTLVKRGHDINKRERFINDETDIIECPLYRAMEESRVDVLKTLIELGCSIKEIDNETFINYLPYVIIQEESDDSCDYADNIYASEQQIECLKLILPLFSNPLENISWMVCLTFLYQESCRFLSLESPIDRAAMLKSLVGNHTLEPSTEFHFQPYSPQYWTGRIINMAAEHQDNETIQFLISIGAPMLGVDNMLGSTIYPDNYCRDKLETLINNGYRLFDMRYSNEEERYFRFYECSRALQAAVQTNSLEKLDYIIDYMERTPIDRDVYLATISRAVILWRGVLLSTIQHLFDVGAPLPIDFPGEDSISTILVANRRSDILCYLMTRGLSQKDIKLQ